MNVDRDTTRIVRSWLEEGVTALPDRVLDGVLDQIPATPQRRSWWPPRRFVRMHTYARLGLAGAAVLVVTLVAINLVPGVNSPGGPPAATPTATPASTPGPTPGPTPIPFSSVPVGGVLTPAAFVLDGAFPLAVAFDVPAGWAPGSAEQADVVGVHKVRGDLSPAWASWAIVANVYGDPCHARSGPLDPPVGPTVDELVTALTGMVGFDSTVPVDVTVDGHAGKRFEVSSTIDPAADGCDDDVWLSLWEPASGGDTAAVPGAVTMQMLVLDVEGTRRLMFTVEYDSTPAEIAEAVAILESVRFE